MSTPCIHCNRVVDWHEHDSLNLCIDNLKADLASSFERVSALEAEVASHERYRELARSNLAETEWKKENARLREALEFIAGGCLVPPDGGSPRLEDAIATASLALVPRQETKGESVSNSNNPPIADIVSTKYSPSEQSQTVTQEMKDGARAYLGTTELYSEADCRIAQDSFFAGWNAATSRPETKPLWEDRLCAECGFRYGDHSAIRAWCPTGAGTFSMKYTFVEKAPKKHKE